MFSPIWPAIAGWLAVLVHWSAAFSAWMAENRFSLTAITVLLCFACRERGTSHSWLGSQGARALFWGAPVAGSVWWLAPDLPLEAIARVWVAATLGMILLPHGAGQDLAVPWTTPDDAKGLDRIARGERLGYLWLAGMGRLTFLAVALAPWVPLPPLWIVLGGLSMPTGYLAALAMPALSWRFRTAQEWGEGLYGALTAPVLALALCT